MGQLKAADGPASEGAGQFNFSAAEFRVTENEGAPGPFGNIPPVSLNPKSVQGALVTVTRTGGARGRVLVDYTTLDDHTLMCGLYNSSAAGIAIPNCDYYPVKGTLVFDDYQMSTNFVVRVMSDGISNGTKRVNLALSNPRADPRENALQIVPSLGGGATSSVVIVEINQQFGCFSIERAKYRVEEAGNGVFVDVILPGGGQGTVELYTRSSFGFPCEAGSDYADGSTTVYPSTISTDGTITLPNPADYEPISVVLNFSPGMTRQRVYIPIFNDPEVEFNEDVLVELRNPSFGRFLGNNPSALVTILNDDQPAGAADRDWNPARVPFTIPAYNETPGANGMVNGIAVQTDQKTLIGGSFSAYNAASRRGVARINLDGSVDTNFDPGSGANGLVTDVAFYSAGSGGTNVDKIIVVGGFTSFNNLSRNGIAQLNSDGSVDPSFDPGTGADGIVRALAVLDSGKIYVAGDFNHFNGVSHPGLVRLLADGSLDPTFDPGSGADGTIWALAAEGGSSSISLHAEPVGGPPEYRTNINTGATSGKVRIAFEPQCVPDTLRIYQGPNLIFDSRLTNSYGGDENCANYQGPLHYVVPFGSAPYTDLTFVVNEGGGDPGTVWSLDAEVVTASSGQKLYVGGEFTSFNGVNQRGIARLDDTGAVDLNFDPGDGLNGAVYALAVQRDSKVLAGGEFTRADGSNYAHLVRFNSDGTVDNSFSHGGTPNDSVFSIKLQPDDKIVLGGIFTTVGEVRRKGVARLMKSGMLDTSFLDTAYNQFAGLANKLSFEAPGFVNCIGLQADGSVLIGGSFTNLGGNVHAQLVSATERVWTRQEKVPRYNVARLIGGRTPGPGTILFDSAEFSVDENAGALAATLARIDGRLGTIQATFTTTNGSANQGSDYQSTQTQVRWNEFAYVAPKSVGYVGNNFVLVPILDDMIIEDDESFKLSLMNCTGSLTLGGEVIPLGPSLARNEANVIIRDDDQPPAMVGFAAATYSVSETGKVATVQLLRTGNTNSTVLVTFETQDGTAVAGNDYTATTKVITFRPNETAKTVQIEVLDDNAREGDETVHLLLTSISASNSLGLSAAILTIRDDDVAPILMAPRRMPNGTLQMQISGLPNSSVVVQASSDLVHWSDIGSVTNSSGGQVFWDLDAASFSQRFYRAKIAE